MIEEKNVTNKLMLAIRYDSKNKGVFLFLAGGSYEKSNSFVQKSNLLAIKHQLFYGHPESFYGVQLNIKTFHNLYESSHFNSVEGIWFPIQEIHFLLEAKLTGTNIAISDSIFTFIQVLTNLKENIESNQISPNRHGRWKMKRDVVLEAIPKSIPQGKETGSFANEIYNNETIFQLLDSWIQIHVITFFPENQWLAYKQAVSDISSDSQISYWLQALERPDASFTLSKHLYPICVQQWNGQPPEPFQLQLIVYEPVLNYGDWTLEWFIKEWESGLFVSFAEVVEGKHPFRTNPISWLQTEIINLKADGVTLSFFNNETPVFYLSTERFSDYLINDVKVLEENGISVLIPESLQNKISPRLNANLSLYQSDDGADDSSRSWVQSHVSWKLDLNDIQMDEETFRHLVEQKKQMFYIHDQWVIWDMEMATNYLMYIDRTKNNQHMSFFDGLRVALGNQEDIYMNSTNDNMEEIDRISVKWSLTTETKNVLDQQAQTNSLSPLWLQALRDYQQKGTTWLLNMREVQLGCCLADDMGLGKTIQTIAYIDEVFTKEKPLTPFLILCPSSLIHNWSNELEKFSNNLTVYKHQGSPLERENQWNQLTSTTNVVICSYPTATRDLERIKSISWSGCIFDEAQQLKNIRTKQRKAMTSIHAAHFIALTGTPIENHPFEMWTMMDLLNPGLLKDEAWFSENFLDSHSSTDNDKHLDKLRAIVRPFLLRRTKEAFMEELSLPKKTLVDHTVTLTREQQILYEAVVEELMKSYEDQPLVVQRALLFKTMTKLKQICNHPGQVFKENGSLLLNEGRSEKWDLAVKIMEEWLDSKKRGLIFTQYRFIGALIQEIGKQKWNLPIPFFHGGLTSNQREEMIAQYQSHRSAPIMVISLRAGGFGINMTEASEMIHYDRWWNPAVEDQATDRIHRIGQTKPVHVHRITTKGTIEDRIADLLHEKKQLQKAVIDGRPLPIWELSKEELTELFSLK